MKFSTVGDSTDSLRADLSALTALVRKALEERGDEETLTAPDAQFGHGPNNTSVRAMHVEGSGPLVFVKVKFPLLNVSGSVQEASEATTGAQFNRAKQALPGAVEQPFSADMAVGPLYDADQVEALKNQVLGSLKEAKSLQSFKAEEFLSVVVFGPPGGTGSRVSTAQRRGTVLAIRVKKSDIDKFAAGKLDASKFKERAVIAAYCGSGYDVTSVNSWVRSGSSMQLQPEDFGQGLQRAK